MKWIHNDKIIKPVISKNELLEMLETSYVRIEYSKYLFTQIVKENSGNYYVEKYLGSEDISIHEINLSDDLWDYVKNYIVSSEESAKSDNNFGSIACDRASKIVFIAAFLQWFISISAYFLDWVDYAILVNSFGTLIMLATAYGLKEEKFFVQFGDASRASAQFTFWSMALVGVLVSIAVIVFSFVLK